ncbi:class I SAM-dependent methyltransferase [Sulfurirhabdus autotrophica]|uniref:Methyltransferase family protein n=1 Tax=Sulfurirhabdus autotrophica TaxID=1706046 RepID=A0A4R3Y3B4_9PROT|nr:class I SAM-dependent methyltransferase [Sulfurirhabdus autotrophica]TCV85841.1 methyltransferase family protein [Sulfurirhabdus autotrophica]
MDTCQVSVNTFDRLAETYAQKYLALNTYDTYYREFCSHVPRHGATVLDVACGPGNVSAFLMRERPDLQVLGIDLSPNMVQLAQNHVSTASFLVQDCRQLVELGRVFDGIAYAFGLNYLNQEDAEQFFRSLSKILAPNGVLYLSAMLGPRERPGLQTSSSGDQIYVHYRSRQEIEHLVQSARLEIVFSEEIGSPANASKPIIDMVLVARRIGT